jgi:hypothetical protein
MSGRRRLLDERLDAESDRPKRTTISKANEISRRQFAATALSTAPLGTFQTRAMADAKKQKLKGDRMTTLTPCLLFDGNCQQAIEFYKSCFGGELTAAKVADSPVKDQMPAVQRDDRILNARLRSSNLDISASDWLQFAATRFAFT